MNHIQAAIAFLREDGAAVDKARAFDGQRTIQVDGVYMSRSKIADVLQQIAPVAHVAPEEAKLRAYKENMDVLREILDLKAGESLTNAVMDLVSGLKKEKLQERLDHSYQQRNALCIAFARMALSAGLKAGWGTDNSKADWDADWRTVVYVQLADGVQVSWHMSPPFGEQAQALLPAFDGEWDGTFVGRDPMAFLAALPTNLPTIIHLTADRLKRGPTIRGQIVDEFDWLDPVHTSPIERSLHVKEHLEAETSADLERAQFDATESQIADELEESDDCPPDSDDGK